MSGQIYVSASGVSQLKDEVCEKSADKSRSKYDLLGRAPRGSKIEYPLSIAMLAAKIFSEAFSTKNPLDRNTCVQNQPPFRLYSCQPHRSQAEPESEMSL